MRLLYAAFPVCLLSVAIQAASEPMATPSLEEAIKARKDVYGEAAMAQPNGASYEFFEKLLPPPRYVNADFHYYPIVLSGPNTTSKARLISNGMGVNLRAGSSLWTDNGTPVFFRVGPDQLLYGTFPDRLLGEPKLADGYLPIVELQYMHQSPFGAEGMVPLDQQRIEREAEVYKLEAFGSTTPALADYGVVLARFELTHGIAGPITVQVDAKSKLKFDNGRVINDKGNVLAWFGNGWKWMGERAQAFLDGPEGKHKTSKYAVVAIATKPLPADKAMALSDEVFQSERARCVETWNNILKQGMNVQTPEPMVNNAWRHLIIQNFELINGDRIHYSQGNQYDKLYESEGSDAALAMMVWGFEKDTRRLLVPLLDFTRKGLEFHQAGFKLNDVCRYYWQTRDPAAIKELRSWSKPKQYRTSDKESVSGWEVEAKRLDENRTGPHGLYPLEQYCGDIHTPVQTLNAASKAWRVMRDLGAVLAENGLSTEAGHYSSVAREFRKTVLTAIDQSVNRSTTPPFIPVALYTNEPAHDPICDVRIGSYWNIIIGYTIASGIFPPGSEQENWLPEYQEQHGGLFMGMIRAGGMSNTWWNSEYKVNPLYGTRYALDTLRRDNPERGLVSFYGMLAQGFTRNTFNCGEGAGIVPVDARGRLVSLPPNSAANAHFLSMLRYLLVQDWDVDDDGKPDTLRLLFATPKRWMEDGKEIRVEDAPSAFGRVSIHTRSALNEGKVFADVKLPTRNQAKSIRLRARVPDGWRVSSANVEGRNVPVKPDGTVDLTGMQGDVKIDFAVARK